MFSDDILNIFKELFVQFTIMKTIAVSETGIDQDLIA